MALSEALKQRIESIVGSDRVVLFMKGTRHMPQCGFSAATVGILDSLVPEYTTVNVLEDQAIREGIKQFSSWPTIPQLYVNGEFMGGCDVARQMFNSGALHQALGVPPPDRTPPEISISDEAASVIGNALRSQPGSAVHLSIDSRWQHNFSLGPVEGHEVKAESNGVELLMDVATAQKARGMKVGMEDTLQGRGLKIENPNAPAPVKSLSAHELKRMRDSGEEIALFDVREPHEIERARIEGAKALTEAAMSQINALPKDTPLVFYCHFGQRSQTAAEHFRLQGFTAVYHLAGGIDAWSREVDSGVPRY
ncbi:MAG TPA: Grx4 family monothiol glutaredoxin [Gammaproteobacteria bacterium]|nr:Grx4 family monothiol glutaredoxin [Gammaproteobacteria bacterium]